MTITAEKLLSLSSDAKPAILPTPSLGPGEKVFLATLSPDEIDQLETHWQAYKAEQGGSAVGIRAFAFAYCLANADNSRQIDPGDKDLPSKTFCEAVEVFGGNATLTPVVTAAFDVICKKIGWSKADVEALEKNSEATTDEGGNGAKQSPKAKPASSGSKASKRSGTSGKSKSSQTSNPSDQTGSTTTSPT